MKIMNMLRLLTQVQMKRQLKKRLLYQWIFDCKKTNMFILKQQVVVVVKKLYIMQEKKLLIMGVEEEIQVKRISFMRRSYQSTMKKSRLISIVMDDSIGLPKTTTNSLKRSLTNFWVPYQHLALKIRLLPLNQLF